MESKIEATHRLQAAGLWEEASRYRDEVRRRHRNEGKRRSEAGDLAWQAMLERYPPHSHNVEERIDCGGETGISASGLDLEDPAIVEAVVWVASHFPCSDLEDAYVNAPTAEGRHLAVMALYAPMLFRDAVCQALTRVAKGMPLGQVEVREVAGESALPA